MALLSVLPTPSIAKRDASRRYLLTLLVFKFLLKYDRLAHVRMKKSILWMNHRSSGVRSKESQRISRMRRFNGFFFSVSGRSGDVSSDCGCGRVFASTVVVSLLADMMVDCKPGTLSPRLRPINLFSTIKSMDTQSKCIISYSQGKIQ